MNDDARAGKAQVDDAKVDGAKVDGAKVDGAKVDGAKVDGAKVDGAKVDEVTVRPARCVDARAILTLVNELAMKQVMLPRSPASVIENIRDFVIAERGGTLIGCGALAITWTDLAEIRSLAVHPDHQKDGVGRQITEALIDDARRLGIPRLYAFTYVPGFFRKLGFDTVAHDELPHKVFNDCMHCPKFQACDEIAMERVLDESAAPRLFGKPVRAIPMPTRRTDVRPTAASGEVAAADGAS